MLSNNCLVMKLRSSGFIVDVNLWTCVVEAADCSDGCRRLEETDEEHDFCCKSRFYIEFHQHLLQGELELIGIESSEQYTPSQTPRRTKTSMRCLSEAVVSSPNWRNIKGGPAKVRPTYIFDDKIWMHRENSMIFGTCKLHTTRYKF